MRLLSSILSSGSLKISVIFSLIGAGSFEINGSSSGTTEDSFDALKMRATQSATLSTGESCSGGSELGEEESPLFSTGGSKSSSMQGTGVTGGRDALHAVK